MHGVPRLSQNASYLRKKPAQSAKPPFSNHEAYKKPCHIFNLQSLVGGIVLLE